MEKFVLIVLLTIATVSLLTWVCVAYNFACIRKEDREFNAQS